MYPRRRGRPMASSAFGA